MIHEIGIVCVVVALLGGAAYLFRQPIIPAYIIGGIIVGPLVLKWIHDPVQIKILSDLTIVFVMFLIGLEMDVRKLKAVGPVVSLGAVLQVLVIALIGTGIAAFWFNIYTSIYIGIFFAFGSTMLAVKVMADRKQTDTLNGRIALGILLMQDIIAIVVLSLLASKSFSLTIVLGTVLKSFGMVVVAVLMGQFVFPVFFRKVAKSSDLLVPISVGICFIFAFLAENQGLSASIGAFVTGVSLANLPYSLELTGRVKALRDFFLPIFFAGLGLQVAIPSINMMAPIIVIILVCIVIKPLVISVLIAMFGYQPRTSFLAAQNLMPISEFGLIVVAVGVSLGSIKPEIMTMCMVVMMASMLFGSYFSGERLYKKFAKTIRYLDKIGPDEKEEEELSSDGKPFDTILIGCHRLGRHFLRLMCLDHKVKIIEIDPDRLIVLKEMGYNCIYADMADFETWEKIGDISKLKLIVSTIPDTFQNLNLLRRVREVSADLPVIVTVDHLEEVKELYDAGASKVICAHLMAGRLVDAGDINIFDPALLPSEKAADLEIVDQISKTWRINECGFSAKNSKP